MRLIIDIPKEFEKHFNADRFKDSLLRLCCDANCLAKDYEVRTAIMLINAFEYAEIESDEQYTKPDIKAAEDEVWELARRIICPSDCCKDSISTHTKEIFNKEGWEIRGIFNDLSYQEAKARYEEWLKQEDEIKVGDELKDDGNIRAVVLDILDEDYESYEVFTENGIVDEWQKGMVVKTGRHFDEVEGLLKKMGE